jgi:hypothetical protein
MRLIIALGSINKKSARYLHALQIDNKFKRVEVGIVNLLAGRKQADVVLEEASFAWLFLQRSKEQG